MRESSPNLDALVLTVTVKVRRADDAGEEGAGTVWAADIRMLQM